MSTFKKVSFSWVLALFVWQAANAQAVKMYSDKAPSAEEMGSILFSNQPAFSSLRICRN